MSRAPQPTTTVSEAATSSCLPRARFPMKLRTVLEDATIEGNEHIVSWLPTGNAFKVHKPELFSSLLMKRYFRQSHFRSFTRQLYHYGFERCEEGAFCHPLFQRDDVSLSWGMRRKTKDECVRICDTSIHHNNNGFSTFASSAPLTKKLVDDGAFPQSELFPFTYHDNNLGINNGFTDPMPISSTLFCQEYYQSNKAKSIIRAVSIDEAVVAATENSTLLLEPRSIEQMCADPLGMDDASGETTALLRELPLATLQEA